MAEKAVDPTDHICPACKNIIVGGGREVAEHVEKSHPGWPGLDVRDSRIKAGDFITEVDNPDKLG